MEQHRISYTTLASGLELMHIDLPVTTGMTPDEWIQRFHAKGIHITDGVSKILHRMKPTDGVLRTVTLLVVKNMYATHSECRHLDIVYAAAAQHLTRIHIESMLQMRDLFTTEELRYHILDGVVIGFFPDLKDDEGNPQLLMIRSRDGRESLAADVLELGRIADITVAYAYGGTDKP